jgi:hypothetical protein
MYNGQLKLTVAAIALAISSVGFAAFDGQQGMTSQGQFDINLSLNPEVQISGLKDAGLNWMTEGDATPQNDDMVKQVPFCVYSSAAENRYTITMKSTNGPNTLYHTEPGNYKLLPTYTSSKAASTEAKYSYYVNYKDLNSPGAGKIRMIQGQKISGVGSGELNCADQNGQNAELEVHFRANDNLGLSPGVYADILQVMVAPE